MSFFWSEKSERCAEGQRDREKRGDPSFFLLKPDFVKRRQEQGKS